MKTSGHTQPATAPDLGEISSRLDRIDSFILCARETAQASSSNESRAVGHVLLHVQNALYEVRCALDPSLSGDDEVAQGGAA